MKIKGCFFSLLIVFISGLYIVAQINHYNDSITKISKDGQTALVTISKGESSQDIKNALINNGIIQDTDILFGFSAYKIYGYITKFENKIQAGSYVLSKGSSIKEVANLLQQPEVQQTKVTIKEGLRIEEVADEFNKVLNDGVNIKSKYNKEDFLKIAKNYSNSLYEFLNSRPISNKSLEGYLFPDTYQISPGASAQDIINIMLNNFNDKIFLPNLSIIKSSHYSLHQILTIASILQREVQSPEDMGIVADIFYRRNQDNFPLGADSTVQYALGYSKQDNTWWTRTDLTVNQLNIDSPYNTRRYVGLPPSPIDSPGLIAFTASISPKQNSYYYFITDKDGIARYAKTLIEHENNIKKYLS